MSSVQAATHSSTAEMNLLRERLGGVFDSDLIQAGSSANGTLRGLVQTATLVVDEVGKLPQPVIVGETGGLRFTGGAGSHGSAAQLDPSSRAAPVDT